MLTKERRRLRLILLIGTVGTFVLLCMRLNSPAALQVALGLSPNQPHPYSQRKSTSWAPLGQHLLTDTSASRPPASGSPFIGPFGEITSFPPPTTLHPGGSHPLHLELQSLTTRDRKFFRIRLGSERGINPNIIPHPRRAETWIVVAQRAGEVNAGVIHPAAELVCDAKFVDGALTCVDETGLGLGEPAVLPVAPTASDDPALCPEELAFFTLNVGPHDARVFYGPEGPLIVYGSNSQFTCFGQWMQDARELMPERWSNATGTNEEQDASGGTELTTRGGTELQRPEPYSPIEKNWFLFWDAAGEAYVHFDIAPRRSFAKLHADGSVGADLAPRSAKHDDACLARYMPQVPEWMDLESLHQATNSLSVTLCRRTDPECTPSADNTFVFAIVQHKTYFDFHAAYHPYVMVFRQSAPFGVWAVSKKPIWISGRGLLPSGDTEMFYITSMSWRTEGQRYHGYVDDALFLAFGIEDRETAGIDVFAGDLLANLGLC